MNAFKRTNKVTGIHWLKDSIENVEIKVKLKPQDGIMSLPKLEDYSRISKRTAGAVMKSLKKIEEKSFRWQEKVFNLFELVHYSDVHNCTTDVEMNYHKMLNNSEYEASKLFSYVHSDFRFPLPSNQNLQPDSILNLQKCFKSLNLNEKLSRGLGDTSSDAYLFISQDSINTLDEEWISMHIALDNSEYNVDNQLVFKQEAILLSLYYNAVNKCLLICPDTNDFNMNPYCAETREGVALGFEYAVEVAFDKATENSEDLVELLKRLETKWERKHRSLTAFSMPPIGKKTFLITFEILTATDFKMVDLYIDFKFKLSEELQCSDALKGRTHISSALIVEDLQEWHFGHQCELTIETSSITNTPSIQLFLEVISTDWWGRHRTEGYGYTLIPLKPGIYRKKLSCLRPEERNEIDAESRRFFVGGCHLIKYLDVLAEPQLQDANFKYRSTGAVIVRWQVVSQSPIPCLQHFAEEPVPSTSTSDLLQGAETVLRQYRKARARLAAATKGLDGDSDG